MGDSGPMRGPGLTSVPRLRHKRRVTYCLGINVDAGLVFASDSRTNAGADQISTHSKMHRFHAQGERTLALLSAGNLATTQAVLATIERHIRQQARRNLMNVEDMQAAAEYVGAVSTEEQQRHRQPGPATEEFAPEATFILGGQIRGDAPRIELIYPQGNFVRSSPTTPYLQVGEVKYGKPILDRIVERSTGLDAALKCALVSMDSTMRSNATVGPPVEYLIYQADTFAAGAHDVLAEDDGYLLRLRRSWADNIRTAFERLPAPPATTAVEARRRGNVTRLG